MSYRHNARWLMAMAPFKALSTSAAYLVPFFQLHHLSSTEFLLVQAAFSFATVVFEVPSGYLADRFGPARCIKLSAPIAAGSMIAYGLSSHLWQFVLCEIVLAVANSLLSGADASLLYDSMIADGKTEEDFVKKSKHINALGFVGPVVALPIAFWIVDTYGVGATIVCDGIAALFCIPISLMLVEAPVHFAKEGKPPTTVREAWADIRKLFAKRHIRLLVLLTVSLGTATYIGAWLSAQTYAELHIPLEAFAAIFAGRQLWKAAWSTWYHPRRYIGGHMTAYALMSTTGLAGMASLSWFGAPLMLCLDVVHALQSPAIVGRLNSYMPGMQRATLNSVINMVQRTAFGATSAATGVIIDVAGLRAALIVVGVSCGAGALYALRGLTRMRVFAEKE